MMNRFRRRSTNDIRIETLVCLHASGFAYSGGFAALGETGGTWTLFGTAPPHRAFRADFSRVSESRMIDLRLIGLILAKRRQMIQRRIDAGETSG